MNTFSIKSFTSFVRETFLDRVECLIFFGSHRYERSETGSDYDFYILLTSFHETDVEKVSQLHHDFPEADIAIYYRDMLPVNPENFADESQGAHFIENLALGETLIGSNIFIKYLTSLSRASRNRALLNKIESYYGKLLKGTLTGASFMKYAVRILQDQLLVDGKEQLSNLCWLDRESIIRSAWENGFVSDGERDLLLASLAEKAPQQGHVLTILTRIIAKNQPRGL